MNSVCVSVLRLLERDTFLLALNFLLDFTAFIFAHLFEQNRCLSGAVRVGANQWSTTRRIRWLARKLNSWFSRTCQRLCNVIGAVNSTEVYSLNLLYVTRIVLIAEWVRTFDAAMYCWFTTHIAMMPRAVPLSCKHQNMYYCTIRTCSEGHDDWE